jgi:purine-binding chemotaxis protein CheW
MSSHAPGAMPGEHRSAVSVLTRVGSRVCAIAAAHVSETMRPLPVEPFANMPSFVLGVSIVRGAPVPVVDLARLLGVTDGRAPGRFLCMRVGVRRAALAVDAVLGVRTLDLDALGQLSPLLGEAGAGAVEAIGALDSELLLLLRDARLVPDSVWAAIAGRGDA